LTAALVAADHGADVIVVARAPVRGTASYLAQGGVASAVGEPLHEDVTLEKLRDSVRDWKHVVTVEPDVASRAGGAAHGRCTRFWLTRHNLGLE